MLMRNLPLAARVQPTDDGPLPLRSSSYILPATARSPITTWLISIHREPSLTHQLHARRTHSVITTYPTSPSGRFISPNLLRTSSTFMKTHGGVMSEVRLWVGISLFGDREASLSFNCYLLLRSAPQVRLSPMGMTIAR